MLSAPDTCPLDLPSFSSDLSMPYTLTPGRAVGQFLAEARKRLILGSRFRPSGRVVVPAQDFDPETGESEFDFVVAPQTATVTGFTRTRDGLIATLRIDGSDVDCVHRIIDVAGDGLTIGARVEAVWSEAGEGILAIAGFRLTSETALGSIEPYEATEKPVEMVPYRLELHYDHAFGPYYGRLFDEIKTNRRIMGVRTPDGEGAFLPPREICDLTHKPSGTWVEIKQTGTVRAMSVIHLEFIGQKQPPPYIYAEIILDGASTRLIHNIAGIDMSRAKELVKPGTRVRAVWREERTGSLSDISHFEVIDDDR